MDIIILMALTFSQQSLFSKILHYLKIIPIAIYQYLKRYYSKCTRVCAGTREEISIDWLLIWFFPTHKEMNLTLIVKVDLVRGKNGSNSVHVMHVCTHACTHNDLCIASIPVQ